MSSNLVNLEWQLAVTLTFNPIALENAKLTGSFDDPGKFINNRFIRSVAVGLGLRIGAALTFVEGPTGIRPHAHLLLVGRNAKGQTLADFSTQRIANYWGEHGIAKVTRITDLGGAVNYFIKNSEQSASGFSLHGQLLKSMFLHQEPQLFNEGSNP